MLWVGGMKGKGFLWPTLDEILNSVLENLRPMLLLFSRDCWSIWCIFHFTIYRLRHNIFTILTFSLQFTIRSRDCPLLTMDITNAVGFRVKLSVVDHSIHILLGLTTPILNLLGTLEKRVLSTDVPVTLWKLITFFTKCWGLIKFLLIHPISEQIRVFIYEIWSYIL